MTILASFQTTKAAFLNYLVGLSDEGYIDAKLLSYDSQARELYLSVITLENYDWRGHRGVSLVPLIRFCVRIKNVIDYEVIDPHKMQGGNLELVSYNDFKNIITFRTVQFLEIAVKVETLSVELIMTDEVVGQQRVTVGWFGIEKLDKIELNNVK